MIPVVIMGHLIIKWGYYSTFDFSQLLDIFQNNCGNTKCTVTILYENAQEAQLLLGIISFWTLQSAQVRCTHNYTVNFLTTLLIIPIFFLQLKSSFFIGNVIISLQIGSSRFYKNQGAGIVPAVFWID